MLEMIVVKILISEGQGELKNLPEVGRMIQQEMERVLPLCPDKNNVLEMVIGNPTEINRILLDSMPTELMAVN